jgi:hypothetical protein
MVDEKDDKEEKQKPEKPKRSYGGGDLNLKKIMIIIGGVVVLQVIILIVVFKVFMAPADSETSEEKNGKGGSGKEKISEEVSAEEEAKIKYTSLKFENITTKDFQWYILLQLGFKVVHIPQEGEEEEETEGGGHGGGKAEGYQLPPELISALKSFIIGYFGEMNIEDVQAKRSGLIVDLTQKLKPLFKTNNYILKNIALEQFTPVKVN